MRGLIVGTLLGRGEKGYDEARKVWHARVDAYPRWILLARCAGDILHGLAFARSFKLTVSVRSGGHSPAGKQVLDNSFNFNLSQMRGTRVNPRKCTLRAEAGCTWRDVDAACAPFGVHVTGGVVSSTGIAGLTLGGGLGWMTRAHGLTVDSLLSIDIITADGQLLVASEEENADLFWACRGGGGNFGIVTSFKYRLHRIGRLGFASELEVQPRRGEIENERSTEGNQTALSKVDHRFPEVRVTIVYGGPIVYSIVNAKEVVANWKRWLLTAPDETTAYCVLSTDADGKPIIIISTVYTGEDFNQAAEVLKPLTCFGSPVYMEVGPVPYHVLQMRMDYDISANVPQMGWSFKAFAFDDLSEECIDVLLDAFAQRPTPFCAFVMEPFGGAMGRVEETQTAFPWRKAKFTVIAHCGAPLRSFVDTRQYARLVERLVEPFSYTKGVYQNYLDSTDPISRVRFCYGVNWERLVTIKTLYDQQNIFQGNHNIIPNDDIAKRLRSS